MTPGSFPTEISAGVTAAVLAAGLLHAGWNALLKSAPGDEPLLDTANVVWWSSVICFVALPFVPVPDRAAYPFIAASSAIHFGYYVTLTHAYRHGDLSFAYPLMRGTAPLIVAVLGVALLREWPSPQGALGIALICGGIVSIAFVQRNRHPRAAAGWAFANAAIIGAYTLVDGAGARSAGNALSYAFWLMALEGLPFVAWILWRRGRAAIIHVRKGWRRGLLGAAGSVGAYTIVLWAMTQAPVALVAALRETSVLFAALIGAAFLHERLGWRRLAGATSVAAGIAALRL